MKPLPLKWRVSLLVFVVLAMVTTAISIVAYVKLREALLASLDQTLVAINAAIRSELGESHADRTVDEEIRSITGNTNRRKSPEARYRIWFADSGKAVCESDHERTPCGEMLHHPPGPPPTEHHPIFLNLRAGSDPYRTFWGFYRLPTGSMYVLIALPSEGIHKEMKSFLGVLLILGGSVTAGSAVLAILIVLWALRPIGKAVGLLAKITQPDVGAGGLHDLQSPSEIRPFLNAVQDLLRRMDKLLQHQRQFTANASHELRTPLAVAKSTLQTMRTRDRGIDEYKQAMDETLLDLDRMERLIAQMLLLARMDETGGIPNAAPVHLDQIVQEAVSSFAPAALAAGAEIRFEPPSSATEILGNAGHLAQLFRNLLDNALKHGPRGGTITVTLAPEGPGTCLVCVHDQGGKIDPQDLPRLFDRFYRVDSSRSHATGGTGLGLSIAREIARRHGGDIEITSSLPDGTRAIVRLPLAVTSQGPEGNGA